MSALRKQLVEEMVLHGHSQSTQETYVRVVVELTKWAKKSPDEIPAEEMRTFFLYLVKERELARATVNQYISGIKFFVERVLKRSWELYDIPRPRKEKKLPVVLSEEEVHRVLWHVRQEPNRVCLSLLYGCGLRVSEGISLAPNDIDSDRMMLHIRKSKGNKDRYVPLPQKLLLMLRDHWRRHQHPQWLFPGRSRAALPWNQAEQHISQSAIQDALTRAVKASGINKKASPHTLRHSWATHMLEAGVHIRLLQKWLGHSDLSTTLKYTHCTRAAEMVAAEHIDRVMDRLGSPPEIEPKKKEELGSGLW